MSFRWDYTRWSTWQKCPAQYQFRYVDRLPEGPPSEFFVRGRKAHREVERMFMATTVYKPDYEIHPAAARVIQEVAAHEDRLIEYSAKLDTKWSLTRGLPWLTAKMDAVYQTDDGEKLHIIDWKTGTSKDSSYSDQLDLYGAVAASIWTTPAIVTSIVNLDTGRVSEQVLQRDDALQRRPVWEQRAAALAADREFLPRPGVHCQWCPFGATKIAGGCKYG